MMLASAKSNLASMAFIGLTERQKVRFSQVFFLTFSKILIFVDVFPLQESQYIFEETFKLRFKIPFTQNEDTYSKSTLDKVTPQELDAVRVANALDIELYSFAEQLLHIRFNELKLKDLDFHRHYNLLGQESGFQFSWDEIENED